MNRIEAHPDAAIFPMMSQEELADLAADIKENGQRFPIIIGKHEEREVIVDGRNRFEACEIAGVEPKFEQINGHDPKAFILSTNIMRRHLNMGQRAMALAMMYPESSPGKKTDASVTTLSAANKVSATSISNARTVLRDSRALAEEVMSGVKFLDTAYKEAKARADTNKTDEAMLTRLRTEAPDLADLVTEERLYLKEAITALDSRITEAKRARETATRVLQTIFNALFPRSATPDEWAERLAKDVSAEFWSGADELSVKNLAACADVMRAISERINHG